MSDNLDLAPPTMAETLGPIRTKTTKRGRIIASLTISEARCAIARGETSVKIRPELFRILRNSRVVVEGKTELQSVTDFVDDELVEVVRQGASFGFTDYYTLRWDGEDSFAISPAPLY